LGDKEKLGVGSYLRYYVYRKAISLKMAFFIFPFLGGGGIKQIWRQLPQAPVVV